MVKKNREQPKLPEGWPELRKAKASAKTAWSYNNDLIKMLNDKLGKAKVAKIKKRIRGEQPAFPNKEINLKNAKKLAEKGWSYYRNLIKSMHKELGVEPTAAIMEEMMRANAHKYLKPTMEKFGIQGNDAWSLASYFKLATGDVIGYKTELIEESPNKVVYRLYPPCLWFPKLDIPVRFCESEDCFEREAVKIINPKIQVYGRAKMTGGDPYCEVVFLESK